MAGQGEQQGRFHRDRVRDQRLRATVIGRWENDRGLLRTDEGGVYSVTVPEDARGSFDVGVGAWVDVASDGTLRSWSLDGGMLRAS